MYRIAIVEDEDDAAASLKDYLDRYSTEKNESFSVERFSNAIDFEVCTQHFDLVFMDIQMPGINGLEAAESLRTHDSEAVLIFVTNLAQYAVRGYEVDALDFLVKPVAYSTFRVRMDKAVRRMRANIKQTVAIGGRGEMRVVDVSDIEYVEVNRHDLSYHLVDESEPSVVYGSLKAAEEELPESSFVRISNSCLVNMNHIRQVKGDSIRMRGGDTLWFSRSRKHDAVSTITSFFGGGA